MMPIIILGGVFTLTESGAIASVYGLICGRYIYKTLDWKNLPKTLVNTAVGAGTIMLILGSVQTFSVVLARGHIPQILSEALLSVTTNKVHPAADHLCRADFDGSDLADGRKRHLIVFKHTRFKTSRPPCRLVFFVKFQFFCRKGLQFVLASDIIILLPMLM